MRKNFLGNILILVAIGLGLLSGFADLAFIDKTASITSDLFLRLLKLISLPIIFLSITSTISGMNGIQEMRQIGRKIFLYTIATTVIAAGIALLLFKTIDPVSGVNIAKSATAESIPPQSSYLSFVLNIIPSNLLQAFIDNNVIGVAFLSMLFSIAILFLPVPQKQFLNQLFSSLFAALLKVTQFIIKLMPLAIWAFAAILVKDLKANLAQLNVLLLYLVCVVSANLIQGFVVLPLMLKMKRVSPWKAFKAVSPALSLAFFSKSSNATLPVTMRTVEQNMGVSPKVSNITLPLCSVINMNGCAAFILTTVLFVSMLHGLTFGPFELLGWIIFATIAAIGNAGVPMGCFFLTSAFLMGMNVPLEMMGLILPFYTILDMLETALNVWSDACVAICVDKDLSRAAAHAPVVSDEAASS